MQTLRVNNSTIFTIKNAEFSRYYFYMDLNIQEDFQICISVPLKSKINIVLCTPILPLLSKLYMCFPIILFSIPRPSLPQPPQGVMCRYQLLYLSFNCVGRRFNAIFEKQVNIFSSGNVHTFSHQKFPKNQPRPPRPILFFSLFLLHVKYLS